ncbi:18274_t:CDS:2, partial [Racocetra persica]
MLSGLPPFHDREHNLDLAMKIRQGLRPQFQIKIPESLEELINEETEFTREVKEVEKFNKEKEKERYCKSLSRLYQQYKGQTIEFPKQQYTKEKQNVESGLNRHSPRFHPRIKKREANQKDLEAAISFPVLLSELTGFNGDL